MALMHGKTGRIEWDASAARQQQEHAQSWSVDATHDVAEITSMGDTWKTYLGGFRDWTATIECLLDSAGTDISLDPGDPNGFADTEAYLELYFVYDTGTPSYKGLYGQAICTGVSVTNDENDIAKVSYTFQGVSVLAWHSGAALPTY